MSLLLLAPALHAGEHAVTRGTYVLRAEVEGNGTAVVVFEPGFAQSAGAWRDVIAELRGDCRWIGFSRAGLGGSGNDGAPKPIDAHIADLDAVIVALAPGQRVILVGHSYGGLLATEYARRHPERLHSLVLVDPATLGQRHAFLKADRTRVLADDKALLSMLPSMVRDDSLLTEQLDAAQPVETRGPINVPVSLLTATHVEYEPFVFEETAHGKAHWREQHALLFAGFNRGMHRYTDTGHNSHRQNPRMVADSNRSIMTERRERGP